MVIGSVAARYVVRGAKLFQVSFLLRTLLCGEFFVVAPLPFVSKTITVSRKNLCAVLMSYICCAYLLARALSSQSCGAMVKSHG
jgi:hypothetical protein